MEQSLKHVASLSDFCQSSVSFTPICVFPCWLNISTLADLTSRTVQSARWRSYRLEALFLVNSESITTSALPVNLKWRSCSVSYRNRVTESNENNDPLASQSDHLAHGHDLLLGDLRSRVCVCHDLARLSREACVCCLLNSNEQSSLGERSLLTKRKRHSPPPPGLDTSFDACVLC